MKKISLVFLAICMMIFGLFSACTRETETVTYDFESLSSQLEESGAFSDILSPVELDIAAQFYGIDPNDVSESKVLCSTVATTEEIALFKCVSTEAAAKVKAAAAERVETQRATYESYAPQEMPKLDDAIVMQNGVYVFYIVSADASKAQAVLDNLNK